MKSLTVLKKVCDLLLYVLNVHLFFGVQACSHVSNETYWCVCVLHSTQVADVEFRMCFGSSAMDVFISLFSVSTSDGGQCLVKNSDINCTLLVCSLDIILLKVLCRMCDEGKLAGHTSELCLKRVIATCEGV